MPAFIATCPKRSRRRHAAAGGRKSVAFRCSVCGAACGDPCYHGPLGHCPPTVDFDCWVNYWEDRPGPDWSERTLAIYLLAIGGFSQSEVGRMLGVHRRTIIRWMKYLRRRPEDFLDLVSQIAPSRVR